MYYFAFIHWDVSPVIIDLGLISVRWYGMFFALGFIAGQYILGRMYKWEGMQQKNLEPLVLYIVAGTIIGARLGHCLFYEPYSYLLNPVEILKVWEGGLASHGAAIGILLAAWLYSQKYPEHDYLWTLDRLAIVVALGGGLIRLGNLMNSEIIGIPSQAPWAFIFTSVDNIPRHPAQLYESISCFLLFVFLFMFYRIKGTDTPQGSLLGIFMTIVFSLRFLFEYIKENQVDFEDDLPLNMGQFLSIPLVLVGVIIFLHSYKLISIKFKEGLK